MLINRETLEYLTNLARLKFDTREEERLLSDLEKILAYFEELKTIDTSSVVPLTGGIDVFNVVRDDKICENKEFVGKDHSLQDVLSNSDELVQSFPDQEDNFLVVPPIFE
jgi:aspartyl/glutamyl-tRNA(Asn/Gln) amidotransferase C subunit